MTTEALLNLDYKENKGIFVKALKKVVRTERLELTFDIEGYEKILQSICEWDDYIVQPINITYDLPAFCYHAGIVHKKERKWIGNAYGKTLEEFVVKAIIKIYSDKKGREKSESGS